MRTLPLFATTISLTPWLLGCAGQRALPPPELIEPDRRDVYQVELINEQTIAVRVEDPVTKRAIHVYPGQRAVLTLPSNSILRRRLLLTVGPRTYQTMEFRPDAVLRCWTLKIDRSLLRATNGPDIASCDSRRSPF